MAFFWAEEPSAFRVPSAHSVLVVSAPPPAAASRRCCSEPQADAPGTRQGDAGQAAETLNLHV